MNIRLGSGIVLLCLAAGPVGCAEPENQAFDESTGAIEDEVRFGLPTSVSHVPALYLNGAPTCTGILLAPRIVLTAAHCSGNLPAIRVGLSAAKAVAIVDSVIDSRADWLVLKLAAPGVPGTIASLATTPVVANGTYSIAGYGHDGTSAGALLAGVVTATGRRATFAGSVHGTSPFDVFTAGAMYVAGPLPFGAPRPPPRITISCQGDSGGPVMAFEQIGPGAWGWKVYGVFSSISTSGTTTQQKCLNVREAFYVPMQIYRSAILAAKTTLEARAN